MKRFFDIVFALLALVVLSPILMVVACLIGSGIGRPIIFRQKRPGRGGKPFIMYKFRTMTNGVDNNGELLPDEQRLLPLGLFLRKTSIDELPEFWNVLKGEMSLIGPRPLLIEYLPLYSERQKIRHQLRPGISGWAQVNGRNAVDWAERLEMDVWYVENRSTWLDLKIICMTIAKVIKRDGISSPGHVTKEKFEGTLNDELRNTSVHTKDSK